MNRSILCSLTIMAALAPFSLAQAQTNPHAGMSAHNHAAMQTSPAATGVTTAPADNAMLSAAPTVFSATFPHAMTLTSLTLTGSGGETVVDVSLEATPSATVSTPLPALVPGSYSAAWQAKGADGHEMSGVVRFMVH